METMELQVFQNSEFGKLGVMELDGKPYFPAKAATKILGYKDATNAIKQHCKGVVKYHLPTNGGMQEMNFIPEGDLYRLIVHSRLPSAERFEAWVFDEVLPTIRKTGGYSQDVQTIVAQTARIVIQELLPLLTAPKGKAPRKRTRYKKELPTVEKLDASIREEIDEIILSNQMTYAALAEYCRNKWGIQTSRSAMGRYGRALFERVRGG